MIQKMFRASLLRIIFSVFAVLAIAAGVLVLGRSSQSERRLQRTADSLRVEIRVVKANLTVARARADSQAIRMRQISHRVIEAADTLGVALDTARTVLADSAASVTQLRLSLEQTVAAADRLRTEALTYQASLDSLLTTHLVERQEAIRQIEALQSLADTQQMTLMQGRCSTFLGRCPTRWQAFGIGILTAFAVLAL